MRHIVGEISPDCKRQIAGTLAENRSQQKQWPQPGGGLVRQGAKLTDAVHTLAANLNRLIERLKAVGDERGSNEGLATKAGVSSNSVGRMRRADGSVGIVILSKVAAALKYHPYELLYPGFDPDNRPELISDPAERNLLAAFRGKPPTQH